MLKKTLFLPACCYILFFLSVPGDAQEVPPGVAVMPFGGGDETLSAEFQNAVMSRLPELSPAYIPRPVTSGDFPGLDLPSDEPPDPSYLGDSPYVITGEYYEDEEGGRHFQIWLWDSAEGELIYTDELVAGDMEEAEEYLPALVDWIFSQIPAAGPEEAADQGGAAEAGNGETAAEDRGAPAAKDPLNRRLYLGLRAGFSLSSYSVTGGGDYNPMTHDFAYHAAVLAAFRPLPWLSFQAEAVFTMDTLTLRSVQPAGAAYVRYTDRARSLSLMFPLLIKFPLQYNFLLFSPYAGAYFILPLGAMAWETSNPRGGEDSYPYKVSPPLGVIGGLELGFRLGPGLIFTDLRYSADLGTTEAEGDLLSYTRSRFALSLGYQFALFDRKPGVKKE
jgi:hypothetical protein